jgi:hypothetical protein
LLNYRLSSPGLQMRDLLGAQGINGKQSEKHASHQNHVPVYLAVQGKR